MEYWGLYAIAALICLICVVASTPNALADKFLAKFDLHPKLTAESIISINGSAVAEQDNQQFIDDFNHAQFRYTYTLAHPMPSYVGMEVHITATVGRKTVNFTLHPFDDHIDIIKQMGKKITQYRVESTDMQTHLLAGGSIYYAGSRG